AEGRARRRAQVHRGAHALLAPRQHRRCEIARDSSGDDDALPHGRPRARRRRHHGGHGEAFDRARASGGPRRGPRARVESLATMNFIVQGYPAFVYTGGRPFDAKLPTIVFVHGAAFDHSVWQWQSRYFAHHGYGVLAPDLPAHGRSPGTIRDSVEGLADWVAAFIEAATLERAAVVGHSMGSLVALETALRHAARV